jgi:hypothetical protein
MIKARKTQRLHLRRLRRTTTLGGAEICLCMSAVSSNAFISRRGIAYLLSFGAKSCVRDENTSTSRKVSVFPELAAKRCIPSFLTHFRPEHEEDFLPGRGAVKSSSLVVVEKRNIAHRISLQPARLCVSPRPNACIWGAHRLVESERAHDFWISRLWEDGIGPR